MKVLGCVFVFSILFISCDSHSTKSSLEYTVYQTFDEYRMMGVDKNRQELKSPYVAITRNDSTIVVKICYEGKEQDKFLIYHNKGKYWYNVKKEQIDPKLYYTTLSDTLPIFTERYLYNDTIMEYNYYIDENRDKSLQSLTFKTRNNEIRLTLPTGFRISKNNRFEELKQIMNGFRNNFPYDDGKINHRDKNYTYYTKIVKGDSVFLYENDENKNYKSDCLDDVIVFNSLGEFDPKNGKSVMGKMKLDELCK